MKERLKKLRKELGLTQQEFANRIGIGRGSIATYETRDGNPGSSVVSLICREFNVSETWLRSGEGEMFVRQSEDEALAAAVEQLITGESSEFKRRLINALSTLKEEHWLLLEQKLKEIVGMKETDSPTATSIEASKSDQDIEAEIELYRQRRIEEKKQASQTSAVKERDAG